MKLKISMKIIQKNMFNNSTRTQFVLPLFYDKVRRNSRDWYAIRVHRYGVLLGLPDYVSIPIIIIARTYVV